VASVEGVVDSVWYCPSLLKIIGVESAKPLSVFAFL